MRIIEELVLLLLSEESGYLEQVSGWTLACGIAGGTLMDLAFESRIDTDLEQLTLLDDTPLGDAILDPVLAAIASGEPNQSPRYWVEKTASQADDMLHAILERLVERGILEQALGGFWSLSRKARRPGFRMGDADERADVRQRIKSTILSDELPDPRDAAVTGLAHACGAFRFLLDPDDYEQSLDRIELISGLDLLGRTVAEAVEWMSQRLPKLAAKPIPRLSIWKLLLKRATWEGNFGKTTAELYRELGPVFMLSLPFSRKPLMYVLAGEDVNAWVNRKGRLFLHSKTYLNGLESVFGASRTLSGTDGAEHYRMRKALSGFYSKTRLDERFGDMAQQLREELSQWKVGDELGRDAFLVLMSRQTWQLKSSFREFEHMDTVFSYKSRALLTHVQGLLPKFMLRTPSMRSKRKQLDKMFAFMKSSHTPAQREDTARDLLDDYISLHIADPQFFPEADMMYAFIMTLLPPIYTGYTLAFAMCEMYSRPELLARVKEEAARLFDQDEAGHEKFSIEDADVARRLLLETLRLYAPVPLQIRHAANTCSIAGFEIPVNSQVVVASSAAHYLEENFPNPEAFDIDRHLPEEVEKRKHGAYAVFGLGTHTCLGSRLVESQLAFNILQIAHHFDLEVLPSSYPIKIKAMPSTSPRKSLRFRVRDKRPFPDSHKVSVAVEPTGGCPMHAT